MIYCRPRSACDGSNDGQPSEADPQGCGNLPTIMSTAKHDVELLLNKLPEDCTLEDIQYHLYVLEKVRRGLSHVQEHGSLAQSEVEARLSEWLAE